VAAAASGSDRRSFLTKANQRPWPVNRRGRFSFSRPARLAKPLAAWQNRDMFPGPMSAIAGAILLWSLSAHAQTSPATGPVTVEALAEALKSADADVRREARQALIEIGSPSAMAVAPLLKEKDPLVRFRAAGVLAQLGPAAREALSELLQAMDDHDNDVRYRATWAMRHFGDDPRVVGALSAALLDRVYWIRSEAAEVLAGFGRGALPSLPWLIEALPLTRSTAHALAGIGPEAVEPLRVALEDVNPDARQHVLAAMAKMRPPPVEALDQIARALRDEDASVRAEAAGALGASGAAAAPVAHELAGAMRDPDPWVRITALRAAGQIGPLARSVAGAVLRAMEDAQPQVRWHAGAALNRIGADPSLAVAALSAAVSDRDPMVRMGAALHLGEYGPKAQAAVPAIRPALADPILAVRIAAATALIDVGVEPRVVLPALVEVASLGDLMSMSARVAAIRQVARLGSAAASAAPVLRRAMEDPVEQVRQAAQEALARIGRPATGPTTSPL
jgi:HEAT repeat protein